MCFRQSLWGCSHPSKNKLVCLHLSMKGAPPPVTPCGHKPLSNIIAFLLAARHRKRTFYALTRCVGFRIWPNWPNTRGRPVGWCRLRFAQSQTGAGSRTSSPPAAAKRSAILYPSFAGFDRRISFCQGRKGAVLPLAARKQGCQGQNGVLLPLGNGCRAQNGVLVCP